LASDGINRNTNPAKKQLPHFIDSTKQKTHSESACQQVVIKHRPSFFSEYACCANKKPATLV
jgi:hypothetical protein